MEVSGQLHSPSVLLPENEPRASQIFIVNKWYCLRLLAVITAPSIGTHRRVKTTHRILWQPSGSGGRAFVSAAEDVDVPSYFEMP